MLPVEEHIAPGDVNSVHTELLCKSVFHWEKAHGSLRRIHISQANIANTTSSDRRAGAEVSEGVVPIKKELSKKDVFLCL